MTDFVNRLDGSKIAIFCAYFLALVALLFIGFHLAFADGPSAPSEIGFLEGLVQAVLYSGVGISSVHVITGAVVANRKQGQGSTSPAPQNSTPA